MEIPAKDKQRSFWKYSVYLFRNTAEGKIYNVLKLVSLFADVEWYEKINEVLGL